MGFNAQGLQLPYILQEVHRISSKSGDILYDHHIEKPPLGVSHHPQKFLAVLDFCSRDSLIGIEADQSIAGAFCVFGEKFLLGLQTVQLIFFVGGHPTVGRNIHGISLC